MHGLIIREPWLGYILNGTKTWEMRTTPTERRGRIALIRKGTGLVVGTAEIVDSLLPLDAASLVASHNRHRIPTGQHAEVLAAGWLHPWVLRDVRLLPRPVPAGQKSGQVIWVPLGDDVIAAIDAQFGAVALPAPERRPEPSATAKASMPHHPPVAALPTSIQVSVRPAPAPGEKRGEVTVRLTAGAIRNGNLSVRAALHLLPDSVIGGSSRDTGAAGRLTVVFEPGETVETDVAGDKMLLRCRGAVSDFFARSGAAPDDHVCLHRDSSGALRVQIVTLPSGGADRFTA